MKKIFVFLIACLLFFSFQGCNQTTTKLESNSKASSSSSVSDSMSSTQSSTVESTASTPEIKFNSPTSSSNASESNESLITFCYLKNYDYRIMKSLVEGTISNADLEKFKKEKQLGWDNKSEMPTAKDIDKPTFTDNSPSVIGQAAAGQKVKEYIKNIYDYEIPSNVSPVLITRSSLYDENFRQAGPFYNVQYYIPDQNSRADEYHNISADIDAKSGRCLGVNFSHRLLEPNYKPTNQEINNMQQRVLKFVESKIAAGSQCVYGYTDLNSLQDPDFAGSLETKIYLDNGYIVEVCASIEGDSELDFHIYKSHSFIYAER
ncbi:MAG: hypothetical protein Q8858_17525 [Bacteroidota bacterium]|nr:hypothetical protein [Bacteroidota bacterium]